MSWQSIISALRHQRGFPCPQPAERVQFRRCDWKESRVETVRGEPERIRRRRPQSSASPRRPVRKAAQRAAARSPKRLTRRRRSVRPVRGGKAPDSSSGRQWLHQAFKPWVQIGDARQVVQHALVDPQRAGGQRVSRLDVDEPPAPQRRTRRQRAPISVRKNGQGKAEGGRNRRGFGPVRRRSASPNLPSSSTPAQSNRIFRSKRSVRKVSQRTSSAGGRACSLPAPPRRPPRSEAVASGAASFLRPRGGDRGCRRARPAPA